MRGMLGDILSEGHQLTIADMEAGLEHLSRSGGTLRHVDLLLVVLEPYRKALETARRTLALASDLGIPRIYGVASKVQDDDDRKMVDEFAAMLGLPLLASVPYDDAVRAADRKGTAIIDEAPDSAAVRSIDQLLDRIEVAMNGDGVAQSRSA
ncbi:MAG: hypothetical protein ABR575_05140 [Actinomycetota bacterium]